MGTIELSLEDPQYYRRNLPHQQPHHVPLFVTYNLKGSLPSHVVKQLREERDLRIEDLKKQGLKGLKLFNRLAQEWDHHVHVFDKMLDGSSHGPLHLRNPEVAQIVFDSLMWMGAHVYELVSFCIMPNHVHKIVITDKEVLWRAQERHKRFTARECNKILGLQGPFWHHESFDHRIRSESWLSSKVSYTLTNPESAKLVDDWRKWKFSYLNPEYEYLLKDSG